MNVDQYNANSMQLSQAYPKAPTADIFDRLRQCQARFHSACQDFQRVAAERATAEKELQATSQEANQAISVALLDPTQPQQAGNSANGRY